MASSRGGLVARAVPYWLQMDALRWRLVVRASVASFACCLTFLVRPSLDTNGVAAFLTLIFIFIKPPLEPVLVVIAHGLLGGIVVLATWAYSVAGMRASVAVRDVARDTATARRALAAAGFTSQPTPAQQLAALQPAIYRGDFVQPASSAIWAVWLLVGCIPIFMIRAYRVRLFHVMVFADLLLLIFSTISPLLPTFAPLEIGRIYLVPYAEYLAITIASACLIFPTSVRGTTQHQVRKTIKLFRRTVDLVQHLATAAARNEEIDEAVRTELHANRASAATLLTLAAAFEGFLQIEPAYGRLSGRDVREVLDSARALNISVNGFDLYIRRKEQQALRQASASEPASEAPSDAPTTSETKPAQDASSKAEEEGEKSTAAIGEITALLAAISTTLGALDSFHAIESRSWLRRIVQRERLEHTVADLAAAQTTLTQHAAQCRALLDSYDAELLASLEGVEEHHVGASLSARQEYDRTLLLFYTLGVAADVREAAEDAQRMLSQPVRVHWPSVHSQRKSQRAARAAPDAEDAEKQSAEESSDTGGVSGLLDTLAGREDGAAPQGEDNPDALILEGRKDERPNASYPWPPAAADTSCLPRKDRAASFWQWLTSVEVIFAVKVSVVSVALCVPAFVQSSAGFYYEQKGLWAATTAAFCVGMFLGDTVFGLVSRMVGTVIGGVAGMVIWYIGSGSGNGNPFGLAAALGVFGILLIAYRANSTNFLVAVTVTTTAGLVVGYSWIDGQLAAPLNPGIGWEIWWKRTLITLIGLVASFLVCVLPRPSSVRAQLRRTFASTTYSFGSALAATLSELHDRPAGEAGARGLLASKEGAQLIAAYRALIASAPRVALTKLEPAIHKQKVLASSAAQIDALQREAADLAMQLVYVVAQLNEPQRKAFMATAALGTKDGAGTLVLDGLWLLIRALRTGEALPASDAQLVALRNIAMAEQLHGIHAAPKGTPLGGVVLAVASLVGLARVTERSLSLCARQ